MKFMMEYQGYRPGIYAILNLPRKSIYIGKAKCLQMRGLVHKNDLKKGRDNDKLQRDYKTKKSTLIDFVLTDAVLEEDLDYYEALYIYIVKKFFDGFELLNIVKINSNLKDLEKKYHTETNKIEYDVEIAKKNFEQNIKVRFGGKTPNELLKMPLEELSKVVETYYEYEYGQYKTGKFNKNNLLSNPAFSFKKYSLDDDPKYKMINLDQVIFTTIGSYLDQDIYEILTEKFEDISSNEYCLWALNKMDASTVRKFCRESEKPVYVIMWYTESISKQRKIIEILDKLGDDLENYKERVIEEIKESYNFYEYFLEKDIKAIKKEIGSEYTNLKEEDGYAFPSSLPHKETGQNGRINYGRAFVIDEFGVLKQNINKERFLELYMGYSKQSNGTKLAIDSLMPKISGTEERRNGCQCDTLCMKKRQCSNKDEEKAFSFEEYPYTNFIVARLRPPYFVKLKPNSSEQKFDGERRRYKKI